MALSVRTARHVQSHWLQRGFCIRLAVATSRHHIGEIKIWDCQSEVSTGPNGSPPPEPGAQVSVESTMLHVRGVLASSTFWLHTVMFKGVHKIGALKTDGILTALHRSSEAVVKHS